MAELTAVPLTGTQYDIAAGEYRATVTELGAGLRRLSFQGCPVISEYRADEAPPAGSGELLVPWPNRVDRGRYSFAGTTYQLDLSEPTAGNAIHGVTRWGNWVPGTQEASRVDLQYVLHAHPGYPFCLELTASYRLAADDGLTVSVTARNAGSRPAPYGTGSHPYLTAGAPLIDDCELQLPASRWLAADDRGIPVGDPQDVGGTPYDFRTARVIGDTRLDHALTGLSRDPAGRAWVTLTGPGTELGFWAGAGYHWLQVFSGDTLGASRRRRAVAIEPMTCPPNAFVTGTDVLTLAPGDSVTHSWGIQARHS
ncbi:MAG TPA: aldose 1-epimerase family protein [Streptosporangiaceae bacterium]|nr:aldose 1-epimerase family protein [Streptosporangiaceae bacterium]